MGWGQLPPASGGREGANWGRQRMSVSGGTAHVRVAGGPDPSPTHQRSYDEQICPCEKARGPHGCGAPTVCFERWGKPAR